MKSGASLLQGRAVVLVLNAVNVFVALPAKAYGAAKG